MAKRVIRGRTYNTEKATKIAEFHRERCNIYTPTLEELYRKRNGEFFLCTWGTALGYDFYPKTEEEAKQWLKEHGSAGEYEKPFGPDSE